jgi:hypothetical protein
VTAQSRIPSHVSASQAAPRPRVVQPSESCDCDPSRGCHAPPVVPAVRDTGCPIQRLSEAPAVRVMHGRATAPTTAAAGPAPAAGPRLRAAGAARPTLGRSLATDSRAAPTALERNSRISKALRRRAPRGDPGRAAGATPPVRRLSLGSRGTPCRST